MTGLHLPKGQQGRPVTRIGEVPAALRAAPPPDVEPYADERKKIKEVGTILQNKFYGKRFTEKTMIEFTKAAQEMYADIGFLVGVDWYAAVVPSTGETTTIPNILIQGRVNPLEETDHDRIRHEVVTGQYDGVAGYIRGDGTKSEEPRRKLIT
jgi:hypothetical protein